MARIFLLTLCYVCIILDDVTADGIGCKNGGVVEGNSCTCMPGYTGTDCETEIRNDKKRIEIRKDLSECLTSNSSLSTDVESISGAGSGEGSGIEPDKRPSSNLCEDAEKRMVGGKCEFTNQFEGKIALRRRTLALESMTTNNSSLITKELEEKSRCLLWKVYGGSVDVFDVIIVLVQQGEELVLVDYTVVTSQEMTLNDLLQAENSSAAVASDFMEVIAQIKDQDECRQRLHRCDLNAACHNTLGSYSCDCYFNHTDSAGEDERPGSKCKYLCSDVNGDDYCTNGGTCSVTVDRKAVCKCPVNYAGKRCEQEWHIFLNATLGLACALGVVIIISVIIILMLRVRNRIKSNCPKSKFIELEASSPNGEYTVTSEETGIMVKSNPHVDSDEGATVAAEVEEVPGSSATQEEKL